MTLRGHRRGSTFLLVLAMLSLLVLALATLSYTSRLEGVASDNYARNTAARVAVDAGLPAAVNLLETATSLTSTLQPWSLVRARSSARDRSATGTQANEESGAQLNLAISDLSGRVNLNTIRSEKALARFLSAVAGGGDVSVAGAGARLRARAVFRFRSLDIQTTNTLQPDLREPPARTARRFETLGDLLQQPPSWPDLFTLGEVQALSPMITLFSQSPEVVNFEDGSSIPKKPLTKELRPEEIADAVRRVYPDADPRLVLQYAANVKDYVDDDDDPTILTDPQHPEPWHAIFGVERTPLITEVYPMAKATGPGHDEGQFVEIYNPWDRPLALANWRLVVAGGVYGVPGGVGTTINAVIPAGGYLIVTDNYDQPGQNTAPETGSFLSVFGARADGSQRQVIADPTFSLPDSNSFVTLANGMGRPVDIFAYTDSAGNDGLNSYQRNDPRVRAFDVGTATPFAKPGQGLYRGRAADELAMRNMWKRGNKEFESPVDLLRVSTAYVGLKSSGNKGILDPHPWQTPALRPRDANGKTNLDVRLADLFVVPQKWAKPRSASDRDLRETSAGRVRRNFNPELAFLSRDGSGTTETTTTLVDGVVYSYGKLNINTCPKVALYSLEGEVEGSEVVTADLVERFESHRQSQLAQRKTPFLNTSNFLIALFPDPSESHLQVFSKILDQVTVGSSSFAVQAENRVPAQSASQAQRQPAVSRSGWVVALDHKPCELVSLTSQP